MSVLVKWKTKTGWFFGYLNIEKSEVAMPSGIRYKVDDDGFVIMSDGKRYRLVQSTHREDDNEDE